ncbi:hypothetical protein EB796_002196 [Bugula neritina]|uniref:Uncharacterized protein n=1 Tax=Bugula neritina TaxID=10212 RepID=A0A7J7IZV4_BUGNE|nr:hypothetical protein EB796_022246 [Bugula neritina]KAF6039497.1 hypothetical protein EB796_002196 [Bugula neritina]
MNDNPMSTSGAITLITALSNNPNSTITNLELQGNPVEYEFLRILKEVQAARTVTVSYGTVLRSGNTTQDLGKPAVGECGPVKPVLISEENLIINNRKRLQELFTKYYIASTEKGMCNPEELIDCLLLMSPGLNTKQLNAVVQGMPRNHHNLIPLRNLFEAKEQKQRHMVS